MGQTDLAASVREGWGKQLLAERQRRNLKQAEVAEMAGVSQQAVSDAERGQRIDGLLNVAAALGVTLVSTPPPPTPVEAA